MLEDLLAFSRSQCSDPALLRAQGLWVGRQTHQVSEFRDKSGVWWRQGVQTGKLPRQPLSWRGVGPGCQIPLVGALFKDCLKSLCQASKPAVQLSIVPPSQHWYSRHFPLSPVFTTLGIKPRASPMLGKPSDGRAASSGPSF